VERPGSLDGNRFKLPWRLACLRRYAYLKTYIPHINSTAIMRIAKYTDCLMRKIPNSSTPKLTTKLAIPPRTKYNNLSDKDPIEINMKIYKSKG
jgi:hypothetical protein